MDALSQPPRVIEIFYSYSHRDERLRGNLDKHLSSLMRQGLITAWYDRNINAGTEWKHEIDTHLNTAQIILLLVSPDFIASDYCYSIEMTRALERYDAKEAHVIPIILRPTDWKDTPLGKLQALPTDGKPITSRSWHSRDEAFFDVEIGIKKVVKELTKPKERDTEIGKIRPVNEKFGNKTVKAHILFVDDEVDKKINSLRAFFTNMGYSTDLAVNGREALAHVQQHQPDIIVLDLAMPVMEGFEVVRRLRMEGNNVPIIILTAHPDSNYLDEAYETGANAFIAKHIRPSDLLARVETLLRET